MEVIVAPIKNLENKKLHWDFISETCKSFNAECVPLKLESLPPPNNSVIALTHNGLGGLKDTNISKITTVLVGCDDDCNDWMSPYKSVRIQTPNNYYLWSGVALGIFLYAHSMKDRTLNIKIPGV